MFYSNLKKKFTQKIKGFYWHLYRCQILGSEALPKRCQSDTLFVSWGLLWGFRWHHKCVKRVSAPCTSLTPLWCHLKHQRSPRDTPKVSLWHLFGSASEPKIWHLYRCQLFFQCSAFTIFYLEFFENQNQIAYLKSKLHFMFLELSAPGSRFVLLMR